MYCVCFCFVVTRMFRWIVFRFVFLGETHTTPNRKSSRAVAASPTPAIRPHAADTTALLLHVPPKSACTHTRQASPPRRPRVAFGVYACSTQDHLGHDSQPHTCLYRSTVDHHAMRALSSAHRSGCSAIAEPTMQRLQCVQADGAGSESFCKRPRSPGSRSRARATATHAKPRASASSMMGRESIPPSRQTRSRSPPRK